MEHTLIKSLFFDTDCISAFLWVKKEWLLHTLYPGRIILPKPVYGEISKVDHLKAQVDSMNASKHLTIEEILVGSAEFEIYNSLAISPTGGQKIIGRGEAASIAFAKVRAGIVASNNLKDISNYIREFNLEHVTTGDILYEALKKRIITESQGNMIWSRMISKRRKLGAHTFSEFLKVYT
jgi:predicted nucleic acid-binding protein